MHKCGLFLVAAIAACALGCNTADGSRFSEQQEYYVLDSGIMMLTANGAASSSDINNASFRCPSISNLKGTNVTVFSAQAHGKTPHFLVEGENTSSADLGSVVGVSLGDLSFGMLDVYKRCKMTTSEQYVTNCNAKDFKIVESCDAPDADNNSCELVTRGTHKLVATAVRNDDSVCYVDKKFEKNSENTNGCNRFDRTEIVGTYRGTAPTTSCCSEDTASPTLDFCLKPCGCRTLMVEIVPKDPAELEGDASGDPQIEVDKPLRVAIFSNVEGEQDTFERLLKSVVEHNVDMAVSLGNLTKSGKVSQYRSMKEIIDRVLTRRDGQRCAKQDGFYCCTGNANDSNNSRQYPFFCNAPVDKISFMAGMGESEYKGTGLSAYREYFGVSHASTVIGKVQFLMIDSADATIGANQLEWIKSMLDDQGVQKCEVPVFSGSRSWGGDYWPVAHDKCSSYQNCNECIGEEAACVTPDAHYTAVDSDMNCVCLPKKSSFCKGNRVCVDSHDNSHNSGGMSLAQGTKGVCGCTRDTDCGVGGVCINNLCKPPMRFVFSYTPLFDEFGSRDNAFRSREEAASLLSLFTKSGTSAVFSGRVLDYGKFEKAGVSFYLTGGGGADMASFESLGHHWLLLEIPDAYTNPESYTVEVVEF